MLNRLALGQPNQEDLPIVLPAKTDNQSLNAGEQRGHQSSPAVLLESVRMSLSHN